MVHVRGTAGDGRPQRFGHSGWLWFNAYLLYDEETGSLWHHVWGVALSGPLRGTRLRSLPSRTMTWAAWRAERPGTLVLQKPAPTPEKPVDTDIYRARNEFLHLGFGLAVPGAPRYFAFERFPAAGVIEEDVGGIPVAVVRDAAARSAYAWDRRVGGRTLSFEVVRDGAAAPDVRPVLRETGGARAWWLRTGTPVEGTGADVPLAPVPGSVWEDAAWHLQHPRGSDWKPPDR